MTLTNYWWLLIWLCAGGAVLNTMQKRQEIINGKPAARWDVLPAVLLVVPYIIWTGFRPSSFGDTGAYRASFLNLSTSLSVIPALFTGDVKDPGYTVLQILLKILIGNRDILFFLIIAAFQMLCIALTYRKFTSHYWVCIFLFIVSTDYLSWMFNGMRQFIAAAAIFACFGWMLEKKYVPLILTILLVSSIHGSALLMLPIVFVVQGKAWNFKTILALITTAVVMVYIDQFTPILDYLLQNTQYDDMITNEIWTGDDGTNLIRVLVYSVPALLSLFGLRYVREADDPVINLSVNCSIVTMALYLVASVSSGIYVGRLPIYTTLQGYIALPWLINAIFERRSAKLVSGMMIVLYLMFFYYQMHVTWELL